MSTRRLIIATTLLGNAICGLEVAQGHEHSGGSPAASGPHVHRAKTVQKAQRHKIGERGRDHQADNHANPGDDGHEHGVETESLFGFTLGSDTEEAGAKGVALESIARAGKRGGSYFGLGQKLEFSYGVTNDFSLAFALLGDYHSVREVPGFDDVAGRYAFNGVGGEVRWRFLDRRTSLFGLTLHLEPSVARVDEVSGQLGRRLGSENKLILDQELIAGSLFGAINFIYDVERMKERGADEVERASTAGVSAALTYQVVPNVFVGGEARYLRAYEGYGLNDWKGHALFVGPTVYARFLDRGWISASWNVQVAGREAVDRAERAEATATYLEGVETALAAGEPPPSPPVFRRGQYDLVNFERHQLRLKIGFEF